MKKEEYLEDIISHIKDKRAKIEVKKELEAHLDDRTAFYTDAGYDEDYALSKAIERMGNADEIGLKYSRVYNTEHYRSLSYVFTFLYALGIIIGVVLTIIIIDANYDIYDVSLFICIASVAVFMFSSLAYYFAQKSHDDGNYISFSFISFLNILAPLTFIPFGYTILSLFLKFPYDIIENRSYDYFYWIFDDTTIIDFFNVSETVNNSFVIAFIIGVGAFALLPVISGVFSFKSFLNNTNEENKSFFDKAKKYASFLIILSIIGAVSLTVELAFNEIVGIYDSIKYERVYDIDFNEGWQELNSISLPISLEDAIDGAKQNGYTEEELNEFIVELGDMVYFENNWCNITLDNSDNDFTWEENEKGELKPPEYFNTISLTNHHHNTLTDEDIEKLTKLKTGTSEEALWEIVSPSDMESCYIECDNSSKKIIISKYYDFLCDDEYYKTIQLCFENGVLKSIENI